VNAPSRPTSGPSRSRWEAVAGVLTVLLAAAWLARLVPQALAARLQTDECFHAYVSRWIAQHGRLPVRIDAFYHGFAYAYPPLYHLLGAAAFRVAGLNGFLLVNVAVGALLLAELARGVARLRDAAAARWAVALAIATPFLAMHLVRMYVEALTALLGVAVALRLAALWRAPRTRDALVAGAIVGLAIDAKLSAIVLLPLIGALALAQAARRRPHGARAFALALVAALAVAAPLLVRNAVLWGSPIYPVFGRDVNAWLMMLNDRTFTPRPGALYGEVLRRLGPATLAALLVGLAGSVRARRFGPEHGVVVVGLAFVLLGPLQPLLEARHLLPVIVTLAAMSAVMLADVVRDARARRVVDALALVAALVAIVRLHDFRAGLDEPREMDAAFAAIRADVPPAERVLAVETYDTAWYTGRPADWPIPFGQSDPPVEMFRSGDPDTVLAALRRHGLRWVFLSDDDGDPVFTGASWPASFCRALHALESQDRVEDAWEADGMSLVRIPR